MTEAAIDWMDDRLAAAGIVRTGPVPEPRVRAWGTVLTAPTDRGPVWLKAPGPRTVFEVGLYEVLAAAVPDRVLTPIAADTERGWLLLPDGGPTLGGDLDTVLSGLAEVLPRYAVLQRDLSSHVDSMLAAGVTDMRPTAMPARFDEAVEVARSRADHPADAAAIDAVVALRPEFLTWCDRLAASPVPASLDHNDLHPRNVLVKDAGAIDGARFFDWGDSVVAHPFASLLVPLRYMQAVLGVAVDDPALLTIRDAYLEVYGDLGSPATLVEELELACHVGKVARALVWHRALAMQGDEPTEFASAPFEWLAEVLVESYLGSLD